MKRLDRVLGDKRLHYSLLGVMIASAMAVAPAYANDLVQSWGYTSTSNFTKATDRSGDSMKLLTANGTADTALCWGVAATTNVIAGNPCKNARGQTISQSSLVIQPSGASGTASLYTLAIPPTPSAAALNDVMTLTHNNFPITQFETLSLKTATIGVTLNLTPEDGTGAAAIPFNPSFLIHFDETPNNYPCAINPTNVHNPCPDIFALDTSALNQSFSYLGNNYFVSFFVLGSAGETGSLSQAGCDAVGVPYPCSGFDTQENASNPFDLGFVITGTPIETPPTGVPEPGELGLLGLGGLLLGYGAYRRRKEARQN